MKKVLFILKRREDYNAILHSHIGLSTGLYNSATFVHEMLLKNNIISNIEVVHDNNCIDKNVTKYKPTHVIIEALWVVPEKFVILQKLHPDVIWIIRLHSELPFIAGEGNAMSWIGEYSKHKNVLISANSPRILEEVRNYLQHKNGWSDIKTEKSVIYLPNYYPQDYMKKPLYKNKKEINISCFGAVRPLKNHLTQAIAAIEFSNRINKKLNFHVNTGRIEMKGEPMLNNLRGLFEQVKNKGHRLIDNPWTPREEFLKLCSTMDIGLQVSFTETFNIVGADLISQGVPLVGSTEIPWAFPLFTADPTSSEDIINKLSLAYEFPKINVWVNQRYLTKYTNQTEKTWVKYFKHRFC